MLHLSIEICREELINFSFLLLQRKILMMAKPQSYLLTVKSITSTKSVATAVAVAIPNGYGSDNACDKASAADAITNADST